MTSSSPGSTRSDRPFQMSLVGHDRPIETSPWQVGSTGHSGRNTLNVRSEPNFRRGETRLRKAELSQELKRVPQAGGHGSSDLWADFRDEVGGDE